MMKTQTQMMSMKMKMRMTVLPIRTTLKILIRQSLNKVCLVQACFFLVFTD